MHTDIETGSPVCQGVPGSAIDHDIVQFLFDTVTPLSLETALKVQSQLEARTDEADSLRRSQSSVLVTEPNRHRAATLPPHEE